MSRNGKRASADRKKMRAKLFVWQRGQCFWCGCDLTLDRDPSAPSSEYPDNFATLDELRPRMLGGRQRLDNSVVSCWPCNLHRAADMAPEWAFAEKQRTLRENA